MAKIDSRSMDPARYARVKAEQEELQNQYSSHIMIARLCPYCNMKLEMLCKGTHGAIFVKCPQCGEKVFFPPISFRLARR